MDLRAVLVIACFGVIAVVAGGWVTKLVFHFVDGREAAQELAEHRAQAAGEVWPFEHPVGVVQEGADDREAGATAVDTGSQGTVAQAGAVLRGGAWIGFLERLAIYAGIAAHWPEAIPIVLAVKGLGRYPELRSEDASAVAERFIIGTFTSVMWACACTGLAEWLR